MRRVLFSNICLKTVELCRLMETVGEWGDRSSSMVRDVVCFRWDQWIIFFMVSTKMFVDQISLATIDFSTAF